MSHGGSIANILITRQTTTIVVSCITHPLAFVILRNCYDPLPDIPFFFLSFAIVVVLMFLLSIMTAISSKRTIRGTVILARFVLYLLLSRTLGPSLEIERVLIAGLLIDVVFHAGILVGPILGVVSIGMSIGAHALIFPETGFHFVAHWRAFVSFAGCSMLWLFVGIVISEVLNERSMLASRLSKAEESVDGLMNLNVMYQQHVYYVSEKSKEEERKRITSDLHDCLGYAMTNIMMMTEAAKYVVRDRPDQIKAHLARIYQQAKDGLDATRETLHDLHRLGPQQITGLAAINRVLRDFEMVAGIKIRVDYTDVSSVLSREATVAVVRFVQEAIANAFRHGKATDIRVHFRNDGRGMSITVTDNGVGCAVVLPGLGLTGMMQRFADLGGTVEVRDMEWGFEVHGWIPHQNSTYQGGSRCAAS